MKNYKLLVFLFGILFIFSYKITFAGCFFRDDLSVNYIPYPKKNCINLEVVRGCQGQFELAVSSSCKDEYYILDKDNQKLNLPSMYNYPYQYGFVLKTLKYINIPRDGLWKFKLINTNNSENITIYGITYKNYEEEISTIMLLIVYLSFFGILLTLRKLEKKWNNFPLLKIQRVYKITLILIVYTLITKYLNQITSYIFFIVTVWYVILSIAKFISDKIYKNSVLK